MACSNTSTQIITQQLSEQTGPKMAGADTNNPQATINQTSRSISDGPVAILWDIENCPVPSDVRPEDVAGNIRMALQVHPVIKGAVMTFSAYGDFNAFPRRLREGCQRTGIKLVDVPNGRKDAADKAILVDMFLFALDNPPPSSIMLISGDVDFAPALHILGQRGFTVVLVIPSNVGVSSALSNAGKFVWDWPSIVRGEGFAPSNKALLPPRGVPKITAYLTGFHITENPDGLNEEESTVYRGISQSYYNSRDFSIVSQSLSDYNTTSLTLPYLPTTSRSQSFPSALNEVSANDQSESTWWVQPGDLNGLKGQLVNLLELSGGCLPLTRVPSEYQKVYGRPLYVSEYGVRKLVNLFKKMSDALAVDGKDHRKFVYLRNWRAYPSAPPLILSRKDNKKGNGSQEENLDTIRGDFLSDEFSDEETVVVEGQGNLGEMERQRDEKFKQYDGSLEQFKQELEEILVSYSCRIFLGSFQAIYFQRYKKPLDLQKFGVNEVDELFEKVSDVVQLHEEPVTKKKFLVAV